MRRIDRKTIKSNQGKNLVGTVVSTKMAKTVVVAVNQIHRHPVYHKAVRRTRRIPAAVENMELQLGDRVLIASTRPISKTKHFMVVKKL